MTQRPERPQRRPFIPRRSLHPGRTYQFTHLRKGTFVAIYLGPEGEFWRLRIPTGPDSGQQRYANAQIRVKGVKRTPEFTEKLILPTLITEVQPHGVH